jgi:magnesium chelatase subunit H
MRLLFEKGFAPTHAFSTFYRWLKEGFKADALLHFGMHGALEFMPGKKVGLGGSCWPDRLIGNLPNIYLYAANNPSEASLAKRRANAVTISHLTPPLAKAGLYKGLVELKETVSQYRSTDPLDKKRIKLKALIEDQATLVNFKDFKNIDDLWIKILESENALIPDGLHVLGDNLSQEALAEYKSYLGENKSESEIALLMKELQKDSEISALISALDAKFIKPVPGGDLIRSPEILPTGRNIHAFDPFRLPSKFAMQEGELQAKLLLSKHSDYPNSIAMVLWGSDNIKSDGLSIAQAMALIGAKPKFDDYGRLSGAELVSLEELGRPRIDVLMTLSGIFRDLLPLQVKMLANASYKASLADEPLEMNFIKANTHRHQKEMNIDIKSAALRVFSNAEGAYGSNVNNLIDTSAWDDEEELANTFNSRKGFAYGTDGKSSKQSELLESALQNVDFAYQNLESVELGVTTIDHYFDTLGGISRAVKKARGGTTIPVYIGDQTRGDAAVRTLSEQINLETRTRSLNPKWFEPLLKHGHEGVRQIEAQITNTLGWSATTGQVDPDLYGQLSETFVLDEEMRKKLSDLNPQASLRVANRLLEAHERSYWSPDEDTLEALRRGADELEDKVEGIGLAAE